MRTDHVVHSDPREDRPFDWPVSIPDPPTAALKGIPWVTRKGIHVNRTATAWLIRRFIDPEATIWFVEPDEVAEVQARTGARGFDAPGAHYPHQDATGRCSFKAIVEGFFPFDAALAELALIVQGADLAEQSDLAPESLGLRCISAGFTVVAQDDFEILDKAAFLYDSLLASIQARQEEAIAAGPIFNGPVTYTRAS
ncbi:MAG: chromate resistance protein [Cyanobacteria bacterium REEB65]|nr:chromate resistance protein [Cyanobacteria bacterium REEB65]